MKRMFECVASGRVEIIKGEARSAEALAGDRFECDSENEWRLMGKLIAKNMFRQVSSPFSGAILTEKLCSGSDFISAVLRENVVLDRSDAKDEFFAKWIEIKGE